MEYYLTASKNDTQIVIQFNFDFRIRPENTISYLKNYTLDYYHLNVIGGWFETLNKCLTVLPQFTLTSGANREINLKIWKRLEKTLYSPPKKCAN